MTYTQWIVSNKYEKFKDNKNNTYIVTAKETGGRAKGRGTEWRKDSRGSWEYGMIKKLAKR
jgi:hypothetical protein